VSLRDRSGITRYDLVVQTHRMSIRIALSTLAGIVTLLGTITAGCNDQGGVSSWERCTSWFGNPILEWPGGNWSPIFPLLLSIAVGGGIWTVLGIAGLHPGDRLLVDGTGKPPTECPPEELPGDGM